QSGLKAEAAKAIATLDQERRAIEERLADAEAIAARIATELTQAEAVSRGAEAGLAGVVGRGGAMGAGGRVAEAALDAAKAQAARFTADADRLTQQLAGIGDGSAERSAIEQAKMAADDAIRLLAEAETGL